MGPKRVLFMDEISTGLDSSTTYQVRSELLRRLLQQRTKHERTSQCALQADYLSAASAGPLPLTVHYCYCAYMERHRQESQGYD